MIPIILFGITGVTSDVTCGLVKTIYQDSSCCEADDATVIPNACSSEPPLTVMQTAKYSTAMKIKWTNNLTDVMAYHLYVEEDGVPVTGLADGLPYLLIDRSTIGPARALGFPVPQAPRLYTSILDDMDLIGRAVYNELYSGEVTSFARKAGIVSKGHTDASSSFELLYYHWKYASNTLAGYPLKSSASYRFRVVAVSTQGVETHGTWSEPMKTSEKLPWERFDAPSTGIEPFRSYSVPFASPTSAIANDESTNPLQMSLDGVWKIKIEESPYIETTYEQTAFDDSTWDNISLPANVEYPGYGLKQFGKPLYMNHNTPWLPSRTHGQATLAVQYESEQVDDQFNLPSSQLSEIGNGLYADKYPAEERGLKLVENWQQYPNKLNSFMWNWNSGLGNNAELSVDTENLSGMVPYPTFNPVSHLRKKFTLPASFAGKRVVLMLEAVKTAAYLYVNGHEAAYMHRGCSKTFTEVDITDHLVAGSNLLTLSVIRWSASSAPFENVDFWRLSGVPRSMKLLAVSDAYIGDAYLPTTDFTLDLASYTASSVNLNPELTLTNKGTASKTLTVDVHLGEKTTATALTLIGTMTTTVAAGATVDFNGTIALTDKKLWSAEIPNLYKTVLVLKEGSTVLDVRQYELGFRKISWYHPLDPDWKPGLFVNDKAIAIKGANRHENHGETGQTIPLSVVQADIKTAKQNNMNTFRTSHYPPSIDYFVESSAHGMYTIVDNFIEPHHIKHFTAADGSHVGFESNPAYLPETLERIHRMVKQLRNYPTVLIWSMGNEQGIGINNVEQYKFYKSLDTRPVMMSDNQGISKPDEKPTIDLPLAGQSTGFSQYLTMPTIYNSAGTAMVVNPNQACDIYSSMYMEPFDIGNYLGDFETFGREFKVPIVFHEYIHAMGNSGGYMDQTWAKIREYETIVGACVWDYKDQSLSIDSFLTGNKVNGYGGSFGELITDGVFCQNGVLKGDGSLTPQMYQHRYVLSPLRTTLSYAANTLTVTMFNENDFLAYDSANTVLTVTVHDGLGTEILRLDGSSGLDVAADSTQTLSIGLTNFTDDGVSDYVAIVHFHNSVATSYAVAGSEVSFEQLRLFPSRGMQASATSALTPADLSVTTTATKLIVSNAGGYHFEIRKNNGIVTKLVAGDRTVSHMHPELYCSPTANLITLPMGDGGHINNEAKWKDAFVEKQVATDVTVVSQSTSEVVVKVTTTLLQEFIPWSWSGSGQLSSFEFPLSVEYTIKRDGSTKVSLELERSDRGNSFDLTIGNTTVASSTMGDPAFVDAGGAWATRQSGNSPSFPCIGMKLVALGTGGSASMSFRGYGPQETMKDRYTGAKLMKHTGTVNDFQFDYTQPMNNGAHVGTTFVHLGATRTSTSKLAIDMSSVMIDDEAQKGAIVTVHDYTPQQLIGAWYMEDITRLSHSVVTVMADMFGAGGWTTWWTNNIAPGVSDVAGLKYKLEFDLYSA